MNKCENVVIGGIEYVPKDSEIYEDYVIVRTYSAGVFMGHLHSRNGQEVVLHDASRLWYWSGAASLSQMAVEGVSNPSACKFPVAVPEVTLLQVIEIIPCSKKAVKSIKGVPIWKS